MGRRRAHGASGSLRVKRLGEIRLRLPRFRSLRAAGAAGTSKIFRAGVRPQAFFGAEVSGVSDRELLGYRRAELSLRSPSARTCSLTARLLMLGDPAGPLPFTCILRWARELWAATGRRAPPANLTATQLTRAWGAAASGWPGGCPPAWCSVRGPIGAAARELARVGWKFFSASTLAAPGGALVRLNQVAPKDLLQMLLASQRQVWEVAWSVRAGVEHSSVDPLAALARTKRMAEGRFLLLAWGAGGLTTGSERRAMGYDTDGVCALCGKVADDPRHRWGRCDHDLVQRALLDPRVRKVCESWDPSSVLDCRGWVPCSDVHWPSGPPQVRCVDWTGAPADRGLVSGGDLFTDGSAYPCPVAAGKRAGWAVVRWAESPADRVAVYGSVPYPFPQTSMVGEWWAWAECSVSLSREAAIWADCMAVVRGGGRTWEALDSPRRRFATFGRRAAGGAGAGHVGETRHVKAHRDIGMVPVEDQWKARGNAWADQMAKKGASLHGRSPAERDGLEAKVGRLEDLAYALIRLWPLWPTPPKMGRVPGGVSRIHRGREHRIAPMHGRWACSVCGESSDTHLGLVGRPCVRVHTDTLSRMREAGHRPGAAATTQGPLLFCHACGKYGRTRLAGLFERCLGYPRQSGATALRRLSRGEHPVVGQGQATVFRGWRADRSGGRVLG